MKMTSEEQQQVKMIVSDFLIHCVRQGIEFKKTIGGLIGDTEVYHEDINLIVNRFLYSYEFPHPNKTAEIIIEDEKEQKLLEEHEQQRRLAKPSYDAATTIQKHLPIIDLK